MASKLEREMRNREKKSFAIQTSDTYKALMQYLINLKPGEAVCLATGELRKLMYKVRRENSITERIPYSEDDLLSRVMVDLLWGGHFKKCKDTTYEDAFYERVDENRVNNSQLLGKEETEIEKD